MLIDLALVKAHLRVDTADEDTLITLYLGAAEKQASDFLGRAIYIGLLDMDEDTDGIIVNDVIKAAILLTVGHLYANREDVVPGSVAALPMGAQYLLQPYRTDIGV